MTTQDAALIADMHALVEAGRLGHTLDAILSKKARVSSGTVKSLIDVIDLLANRLSEVLKERDKLAERLRESDRALLVSNDTETWDERTQLAIEAARARKATQKKTDDGR